VLYCRYRNKQEVNPMTENKKCQVCTQPQQVITRYGNHQGQHTDERYVIQGYCSLACAAIASGVDEKGHP
jgi:hypothetical protein